MAVTAGEGVSDTPLTPLSFLLRSAHVWKDSPAVAYRDREVPYGELLQRVQKAVTVLRNFGVEPGDRVITVLPNCLAHLELHFAIPGAGAVIVPLNIRAVAGDYAYLIGHSGARLLIADDSLRPVVDEALAQVGPGHPPVVYVTGEPGSCRWETLLDSAPPGSLHQLRDERSLLSINYTSGTTGRPKGVMTTHRGAYLHSLGVIAESGLSIRTGYLWTLPMFHCNGWAYTWAVTASGGSHVCLDRPDPRLAWDHLGSGRVTHFCAAPTLLVMLLESPEAGRCPQEVRVFVGGSPPAPALLQRAAELNVHATHLYGLTETYGPIAVCAWRPQWDFVSEEERYALVARQGVPTVVSDRIRVVDGQMRDVPSDGLTTGEVVMRGNNVTPGYYRDPDASLEAFAGGWFHSGDVAVMHPYGYIEIRDRIKDVVISGGENVSSVEVEQVLVSHPDVAEAAVIGAPHDKWGEVPVAYVVPRGNASVDEAILVRFARSRLAGFKVPKKIVVVDVLPKTATGKIQKYLLRQQEKSVANYLP